MFYHVLQLTFLDSRFLAYCLQVGAIFWECESRVSAELLHDFHNMSLLLDFIFQEKQLMEGTGVLLKRSSTLVVKCPSLLRQGEV